MNAKKLEIPDVILIEPQVFGDNRGFFYESYNQHQFSAAIGRSIQFVQDNHSRSAKGVLRGIHYQLNRPQGKLVRVARGAILDVAVDLRAGSPTFGKWVSEILTDDNKKQLWIPEGFGHAFLALSEQVDLLYKTTDYYDAASERSILWSDADLAINWPLDSRPTISEKDGTAKPLCEAEVFP